MIVYRCDFCEEEVDDPVIVRRTTTRPSGQVSVDYMEYCPACAKQLPVTRPFRVAIYDKRDGKWSHNENWSETICVDSDRKTGEIEAIQEPEDMSVNRHVYV